MHARLIRAAFLSVTILHGRLCSHRNPTPAAAGSHKHYESGGPAAQPGPNGEVAPRLQNLGTHTFPVSTRNASAQRFINQGLNLAYAFNHAEARRAFREAARLSPNLAMAYWGQALVLGPNINALMEPNDEPHALELVKKAQSLKATATPRERALIDALAARYSGTPEHRTTNDRAYADAMRKVHQRFPADPDIAMLYVESMMDLRPWGYWMPDGRPHEGTAEIVALTERMMRQHPKHPGALHMYIHLVESTNTPERAERAADILLTLMPAAGHMVHMPAHIYQRVGRYADAIESNQAGGRRRRGLHHPVPCAGPVPDGLLPAQRALPLVCCRRRRPERRRHRAARKVASKRRGRAALADADAGRLPRRPLLGPCALRTVAGDARGTEPPAGQCVPPRRVALRARPGVSGHGRCRRSRARARGARRGAAGQSLDQPLFSPNTGRAILSIGVPVLAGEIAAARGDFPTPSRASRRPCGSRTRSSTPSRPNGTRRRGWRSAPSCSRPAVRPKPKRSTGRI